MIKPHKTGLSLIRTPLFWWRRADMVRYRTLLSCNKLQLLELPPSNQADPTSESVGTLYRPTKYQRPGSGILP